MSAPSAWAPLAHPVFRKLWLVWMAANVTLWMNDVAAAWLMTSLTTSATMIALVTAASSLPVFVLGLPSGALADIVDRRRLFLFTQVWVACVAAVLYAASVTGRLGPELLLVLVFANGIGLAIRWPVYAAIVPELIPRDQLGHALALNGVAVNVSRVAGPLVAGVLIASVGSEYVFAANFLIALACAATLVRWKRAQKPPSVLPGERFIGAMRLGWMYVRQSRRMKDALVVTFSFFLHSTALIALMPLVAQRLGGGAWTYSLLLSSLGVGAIAAVTQLPAIRARWTRDGVAMRGSILQALCTAIVAYAPTAWVAVPAMMIGGFAWITVANSVAISAQLALPDWVRARGMSIYQMAIMGGTAAGAFLWGKIAEHTSVPASLALCSVSLAFAVALTRGRVLEAPSEEDHTPTHPWDEPVPARPTEPDEGPVMITIDYLVDPARTAEFDAIMAETRSGRLRHGAVSWALFEDLERPGRFVEYFAHDSWADYLRRFDRFTAADEDLQARRHAFHTGGSRPGISRFIARHPQ
jgi:MFS family permease